MHTIEQAIYDRYVHLYFRFIERANYHPDYITAGLTKLLADSNNRCRYSTKGLICHLFLVVTYVNSIYINEQSIYLWSNKYYKPIDKSERSCYIL
jgi:hypothetical protein